MELGQVRCVCCFVSEDAVDGEVFDGAEDGLDYFACYF
jgi:hypothetical protein